MSLSLLAGRTVCASIIIISSDGSINIGSLISVLTVKLLAVIKFKLSILNYPNIHVHILYYIGGVGVVANIARTCDPTPSLQFLITPIYLCIYYTI